MHGAYRAQSRTSLDANHYYCYYGCLTSSSWVVRYHGVSNFFHKAARLASREHQPEKVLSSVRQSPRVIVLVSEEL